MERAGDNLGRQRLALLRAAALRGWAPGPHRDWSASAAFIGYAKGADQSSTPWFRTRFELSAPELAAVRAGTSAALLHVASAGFHEAYVNGVRLEPESMLIPSNSNLNVRVLAHTYDVADALNAGTNTLGLWASPGWASLSVGGFSPSLSKYPLVMAELRVVPHDKQAGVAFAPSLVVVTSNATTGTSAWECSPSNTVHIGHWQWSNYGGESVDHGLDQPGWATNKGRSGGSWGPVTNYDSVFGRTRLVTPEHVDAVGGVEVVPAVSVTEVAPPTTGTLGGALGRQSNTGVCYKIKLAHLMNGWFNASALTSASGAVVHFSYSAHVDSAEEWAALDTVTIGKGGGAAASSSSSSFSFSNRFNWHTFQYITA